MAQHEEKDLNAIHSEAVINHFIKGIGQRAILLSPSFPFLFIGTIVDVMDDVLMLDVETTHFPQLEQRVWFIHIDNIEVFYIEREDGPCIPVLTDETML